MIAPLRNRWRRGVQLNEEPYAHESDHPARSVPDRVSVKPEMPVAAVAAQNSVHRVEATKLPKWAMAGGAADHTSRSDAAVKMVHLRKTSHRAEETRRTVSDVDVHLLKSTRDRPNSSSSSCPLLVSIPR